MDYSELLKILACPKCLGDLELLGKEDEAEGFLCPKCALVYPIRDNIPILLIDEAIAEPDWQAAKRGE